MVPPICGGGRRRRGCQGLRWHTWGTGEWCGESPAAWCRPSAGGEEEGGGVRSRPMGEGKGVSGT
eukprot:scaffold1667_cov98-Isochrysis_galbana.AAC.5